MTLVVSVLWSTYGLRKGDYFISFPNIIAGNIGLLQLFLYCSYRSAGINRLGAKERSSFDHLHSAPVLP